MPTKKCPKCEHENQAGRLTCEICHTKLTVNRERMPQPNPFSTEDPSEKGPTPSTPSPPPTPPPKKKEKPKKTKSPSPLEQPRGIVPVSSPTPSPTNPQKKTRNRRKPEVEYTFLTIEQGKLQVVSIGVMIKPIINLKGIGSSERKLINFYNKNKSLFIE